MLAFVFPGQGSQFVGMGRDLFDTIPVCRETFEEADEVLGFPLSRVCFEGPEDQLRLTATAQPAILTASVAALRALSEQRIHPQVVAGHSLGEYSALVAAGSLAFADAVRLVHKRGTYMQEAVPIGEGAMAAIMGLERNAVETLCKEAAGADVVAPANLNAPGQTVISGHAGAVQRAISLARERGAKRATLLQVSAPFHCVLMEPAAGRLQEDLATTTFHDLAVPLVSNVTATALSGGDEARRALYRQVTAPVLWEESVRTLATMGVSEAREVGPGKVLTGLIRRTERNIVCKPTGGRESIAAVQGEAG
jgi:[acyl-carrier-protein] S-malonyltransferase